MCSTYRTPKWRLLEACGHTACGLEKDSESPRDTVVEGEVMASADEGARGPRILVTDCTAELNE